MWWPALALIGFLALTAVIIALGTMSTGRYEREQRRRSGAGRSKAAAIGIAPTT
jgi:hypothetical protein